MSRRGKRAPYERTRLRRRGERERTKKNSTAARAGGWRGNPYHGVHAEGADEIGGRLPAEHVVERRAEERVAGVQVDGGRAVRGRAGPFREQRGPQPRETAVPVGRLVEVGVHVVGVQHGQPELSGRRRGGRRRRRRRDQQTNRNGRRAREHRRCTAAPRAKTAARVLRHGHYHSSGIRYRAARRRPGYNWFLLSFIVEVGFSFLFLLLQSVETSLDRRFSTRRESSPRPNGFETCFSGVRLEWRDRLFLLAFFEPRGSGLMSIPCLRP